MAKSVLDAPWSLFREMLRYKALRYGASFAVINEAFSTQVCSECKKHRRPQRYRRPWNKAAGLFWLRCLA
ncbi:MAG: transposase [Bradyrhizobium sp.]|nr:transposase [Bradyrhizobium sp.]